MVGNEAVQSSQTKGHGVCGASSREALVRGDMNGFEHILAALHEAALDAARWPRASGLIDKALGTRGSTLACGDGETAADYRTHFMWICHLGRRRRDLEHFWYENHFPQDERIPRLRRLPYYRLFHVVDLYTEEERKASEAYNALQTVGHAGNAIDVRLDGPGGSRILWEINDRADGEGWSSEQLDTIRSLMPHVRQTVHVQQTLAHGNALGKTLAEMLDRTGLGIVQLDVRGRITAANDRARDVLRSGDGLLDREGFLGARARQDDDELQTLLNRALPPFGAQGSGGSTIVRRSGALQPLILRVCPVGRREASFPAWPVAALVLIVDTAKEAAIDPAEVEAAFDLTRMESRVAVMLAQGMSVGQIAVSMDRKESTIRSHVKNMLAKHGYTRQAELARLVQSLAGAPKERG
ncbi:MAG: helix-turn-helix transcriptional regulator [Boseongicola sp. SB0664_bin_43]|uniref:Helix-turn-helix transcriptional regulator n=1 Tax=Boseongicola sp. SB0664_bin_43 TaxID=2604844 RepID=A0A6B0XY41_9RHOB|nr:helix-turn-helix transcriptional regulator [Boseongicola sp. SB0664_bin_43]MYK32259.1 helix-turn-helix transcriptional regulator [Boseongicola sp. SB0670_bin_30]